MIAIPAIDLREGACVQLVGGSYDDERVRLPDPRAVARRWWEAGFGRLHVVDLDAATGRGNNAEVVRALLAESSAIVQVGGGVRSTQRANEVLRDGARYVIAGTKAVHDRPWLAALTSANPGAVIVAADVRERTVVTNGWETREDLDVIAFMRSLEPFPLGGVLVTAVHKEGLLQGVDVGLMRDVVAAASVPVIASGGVSTMDDLAKLDRAGIAGVVVGMALYTGALDARTLAEEYGH